MVFFHSLFFCCFFLYIWLFGDTRLIYHAFGRFLDYPAFFTGWEFFHATIGHPGGIVEYVTGFLSQFYYYPLGGAIVITIVVSLTCLAAGMLAGFAGFNSLAWIIGYAPAIFFLAMHNQCGHPLAIFVPLLINLWALVVYEKIRLQSFASRGCFFLIMFVLLYFVTGACALLFGILAANHERFIRRRLLLGGVYILLTGLLPLVVGWFFYLRPLDIYLHLLPFDPRFILDTKTVAKPLQIYILCILLAVFVYKFFFSSKTSNKKTPTNTEKIRLRWLIQPVVVVLAAIATVFLSTGIEKQHLQADFYASNAMWGELLEYAERFPVVANEPVGHHNIIQALFHTDKLGSDLFSYPQFKDGMFLLPRPGKGAQKYRKGLSFIRLSLLMGRVNVAEKEAYEMLENSGKYPELLWDLTIINIAKGQPETAQVFLKILSRDLIHGKKTKSTLKQLVDDPELSNAKEIIHLRSVMLKKDIIDVESLETVMSDLLEVNPHNKIAFEYMMAYYLKGKQLGKIAENIYRFGGFGYKKIPQHYEEAIMIHLSKTGREGNLDSWQIDPQTVKTANQFMTALKLNPPSNLSSARILAPDFGDTYFYYYIFNQSGAGL
jgi:hypothetical protein